MASAAAKKTAPTPTASNSGASAPAIHVEGKAKTVTVLSKLPMHLELQLSQSTIQSVSGQYGTKDEKVFAKTGEVYIIQGCAYPNGTLPKGFFKRGETIEDAEGGYVATRNIPGDFMREWMRQNATTDMVRNGLIKIAENDADMIATAREHESQNSGLGPLDPEPVTPGGPPRDRRMPKPASGGLIKFGKAD